VSARLPVEAYVSGVRAGDRGVIGRAISLVESSKPSDRALAREVVDALLPFSGGAHRVGVSGVPGAGKSTFLEAMGGRLLDAGHRVAVLAIDPSSVRTGGSILGDKTRMPRLAADPRAFVRPSPSRGDLGGVHRATRLGLIVLEAAGYDVVFVETVGVGQSEVAVTELVDTLVVLLIGGAGDELQGIKKGILEHVEVLVIHKADGEAAAAAERARQEHAAALRLVPPTHPAWRTPVLTASSVTGDGLEAVWQAVEAHRAAMEAADAFASRRVGQRARWLWAEVEAELLARFRAEPAVREALPEVEAAVRAGRMSPSAGAAALLARFSG
jgi:LAO/AO transport system kinase